MSGAANTENGANVIVGGSRTAKSERVQTPGSVWPVLTPLTPTGQIQQVPLAEILRSPFNRDRAPEQETDEWKEFVGSVRTHGIIQPLVARPLPSALDADRKPGTPRLELVIGEGRWLAAAEVKLATVPVIVRQLTDREAIELQTIENDKRKDLSPIQQAEKYQQLLEVYEKAGMNKEAAMAELCKKLEKGKATVYEALRLLKLPAEAKAAVESGKLPPSHAGLIAQLEKDPQIQTAVTKSILNPDQWSRDESTGVLAFREAKRLVKDNADLIDAKAKWDRSAEKHRAAGGKVLTEEERKKLLTTYDEVPNSYVRGDRYCYGTVTTEPWKKLMGKHAPPMVLTHSRRWEVIEIYPAKEAKAAAEKNGIKFRKAESSSGSNDSYAARQRANQARALRMKPVIAEATGQIVAFSAKTPPWQWILERITSQLYGRTERVVARRQWTKSDTADKTIIAQGVKLPQADRIALVVEVLLAGSDAFDSYNGKWSPYFAKLCEVAGVDLKKLAKQIAPPERKAKPAAKKPVAKKKVQASGKKKPGLTATGRARLAAAMKARWAAQRKAPTGKATSA